MYDNYRVRKSQPYIITERCDPYHDQKTIVELPLNVWAADYKEQEYNDVMKRDPSQPYFISTQVHPNQVDDEEKATKWLKEIQKIRERFPEAQFATVRIAGRIWKDYLTLRDLDSHSKLSKFSKRSSENDAEMLPVACLGHVAEIFVEDRPRGKTRPHAEVFKWIWGRLNLSVSVRSEVEWKSLSPPCALWIRKQCGNPKHIRIHEYDLARQSHFSFINLIPGAETIVSNKAQLCTRLTATLPTGTPGLLPCFVLPAEINIFEQYAVKHPNVHWISKAPAKSSAVGLKVLGKNWRTEIQQFSSSKPSKNVVMQQYVHSPFLLQMQKNEYHKIDLRLYVLLRLQPRQLLLHRNGVVKIAALAYNSTGGRMSHFTNMLHDQFTKYKRAFHDVQDDIPQWSNIWLKIEKLLSTVFEPVEKELRKKNNCYNDAIGQQKIDFSEMHCGHIFQYFGVDVVLDSNGQPYLMEINADPGIDPIVDTMHLKEESHPLKIMYNRVYSDLWYALGLKEKDDGVNDESHPFTGFSNLWIPS